jgi:hypothetical protein
MNHAVLLATRRYREKERERERERKREGGSERESERERGRERARERERRNGNRHGRSALEWLVPHFFGYLEARAHPRRSHVCLLSKRPRHAMDARGCIRRGELSNARTTRQLVKRGCRRRAEWIMVGETSPPPPPNDPSSGKEGWDKRPHVPSSPCLTSPLPLLLLFFSSRFLGGHVSQYNTVFRQRSSLQAEDDDTLRLLRLQKLAFGGSGSISIHCASTAVIAKPISCNGPHFLPPRRDDNDDDDVDVDAASDAVSAAVMPAAWPIPTAKTTTRRPATQRNSFENRSRRPHAIHPFVRLAKFMIWTGTSINESRLLVGWLESIRNSLAKTRVVDGSGACGAKESRKTTIARKV